MLHQAHFGSKGGFQTFAAVANQPPGKDRSGHSERVKIEDFSAIPHGGSEPFRRVQRSNAEHTGRIPKNVQFN
jgi:hypothetical protein